MNRIKQHIISTESTVLEALSQLNDLSGECMTLFAINDNGKVAGSLTDGDIRRGLIAGTGLHEPVKRIIHTSFRAINGTDTDFNTVRQCREEGIRLLPKLTPDGSLAGLVDLTRTHAILPLDAVIMAGGRGERLRPLTLDTPKPLLQVGGKAIIDYNVDELIANGIDNIYVTVNYLKEQIEEHFVNLRNGVKIKTVTEPRRMGTIGSLSLIEGLQHNDVILMNSDILTNLNYEKMYAHHRSTSADITIASIPYTVSIPYAIMRMEGERITGLEEKPSYTYFANAGIYILRRELLSYIPKDSYMDAPDFIKSVIVDGGLISRFRIDGTWIDIGSPDDFRYAHELMSRPRDNF